MWTMLAGVPGKLKTLIDRLTAARAANLDKLDANISTRAAASTALSNATWNGTLAANLGALTTARAAKLDLLPIINPVAESPIAANWPALSSAPFSRTADVVCTVVGGTTFSTSSTSLVNVVTITGRGVLNFVAVTQMSYTGTLQLQIIIDGVTVLDATGGGSANDWAVAVGTLNIGSNISTDTTVNVGLDQVPFRSSLAIKMRVASGSGNRYCVYRLRRTA